MRSRAILLSILMVAVASGACKKKEESLSLLVWEGYADPSFTHAFEESHHCKVSASYMGSSDELVAKLRGGGAANYDVISPSSDVAASIARTGLATPLDLSKLPAYSQLSARLRELPLVKANGQIYGVPFMWGPSDDFGRQPAEGTCHGIFGIYDRGADAEENYGRDPLHSRESWGVSVSYC